MKINVEIEGTASECQAFLKAWTETLREFPGLEVGSALSIDRLRTGMVKDVYDLLMKIGKPLHIKAIIQGIGKPVSDNLIISLSTQINRYVARKKIFTRPDSMTYGLMMYATFGPEHMYKSGG